MRLINFEILAQTWILSPISFWQQIHKSIFEKRAIEPIVLRT